MTAPRVLLTGASGFLGAVLARELVAAGACVVGVSRHDRRPGPVAEWRVGDLTDMSVCRRVVEGCDVVVHAAGRTPNYQQEISADEFTRVNRGVSVQLARVAAQAGIRRFIFVSSTGVYGPGSGVQDERSPCRPANAYERSKLEAEVALLAGGTGEMQVIVARPSSVFGERHPWNKLLTWLRAVQRGRAVLAGQPERAWVNYVYVGDVARALALLVSLDLLPPSGAVIINTPATVRTFFEASRAAVGASGHAVVAPRPLLLGVALAAEAAARLVGRSSPLTREKVQELTGDQVFSNEHLRSLTCEFPWFGLEEGLRRTVAYYRSQGLL